VEDQQQPEADKPTDQPAEQRAAEKTPEQEKPAAPEPKQVKIDHFLKIQLRVASVLTAERIEGTDKLMRLEVDLGDEQRQLVAGVAEAYTTEEIVGRRIVVVANLKPARIRGVESQGMLLAADLDGRPSLVSVENGVALGTRVR